MHNIITHAFSAIRDVLTGDSQERTSSQTEADSLGSAVAPLSAETAHRPYNSVPPANTTAIRALTPNDDHDWTTPKMRHSLGNGGFRPTNTLNQPAPHSARKLSIDPSRPFKNYTRERDHRNHVGNAGDFRSRNSDEIMREEDLWGAGSSPAPKRRRLYHNPASPNLRNDPNEIEGGEYDYTSEIVARNKKPLSLALTHQSPPHDRAKPEKKRLHFANTELSNISRYTSYDQGRRRKKSREGRGSPVSQTAVSSRTPSIIETSRPRLSFDSEPVFEDEQPLDPSQQRHNDGNHKPSHSLEGPISVNNSDLEFSRSKPSGCSREAKTQRTSASHELGNPDNRSSRQTRPQAVSQRANIEIPGDSTIQDRPISKLQYGQPISSESHKSGKSPLENSAEQFQVHATAIEERNSEREKTSRDSLGSVDELAGEVTVTKRSSRNSSPQKQLIAAHHDAIIAKSRSGSPSDLKRTNFSNLRNSSGIGHQESDSLSDPLIEQPDGMPRIPVKEVYCLACVMRDVFLVWNDELKSLCIESNGHRVMVPGTRKPVLIGKREVHSWLSSKPSGLSVYLRGGRTESSNGHIVIDFASAQGMEDCLALLFDAASMQVAVKDSETVAMITNKQRMEIDTAFRKRLSRAFGEDRTSMAPTTSTVEYSGMQSNLQTRRLGASEDIEEIKYETEQSPPRTSLRKQMQSKQFSFPRARAEVPVANSVTNGKITSPFSDDRRRSGRQTRSREKSPPRPSPERWTKLNQPKPWKQPIVFPKEGKERVTVAFEDLERLDEGEFLNDNVIAFALRRIQENMAPEHRDKVYFFNSFFYTWLMHKSGKKNFDYAAVRRWTKNKDIFSYPYLVVPINVDLHWFVAIICNLPNLPRKAAGLDDENEAERAQQADPMELDGEQFSMEVEDSQEIVMDGEKEPMSIIEVEDSQADVVEIEKQSDRPLHFDGSKTSGIVVITVHDTAARRSEIIDADKDDSDAQILPGNPQHSVQTVGRPGPGTNRRGKKRPGPPPRGFDPDKPAIVSLDSFGQTRQAEIRNLKLYLQAEALEKRAIALETDQLQGMNARGIPEQSNFSDCGVYLIGYVEEFAKDPRKFVSRVMTRQMDKHSDFESFDPAAKRAEIRDALLELADVA